MARLVWDESGTRLYETGVKKGVLYPLDKDTKTYNMGYAWNGLISVTKSPSGAESTPIYADDIKYLDLRSTEDFGATVEAYTYPDEFEECDGSIEISDGVNVSQQGRIPFGMSYVSTVGNDVDGNDHGYKLHLIYNAIAAPSERAYQTINESPEALNFSWELTTTPLPFIRVLSTGSEPIQHNGVELKSSACITIDSTNVYPDNLAHLEEILYGKDGVDPRLPLPGEVYDILRDYGYFVTPEDYMLVTTDGRALITII